MKKEVSTVAQNHLTSASMILAIWLETRPTRQIFLEMNTLASQ